MTTTMTQADMIKVFSAMGCTVTPKAWDGVSGDKVVTTYGVQVSLTSTGSTVVRTVVAGADVDASALVAQMRKDLAARAKATRTAIRRERSRS